MEKRNFGISMKNIPIPGKKEYMIKLLGETERVIKAVRWKIYWYKRKEKSEQKESYGLKSLANPSPEPELR